MSNSTLRSIVRWAVLRHTDPEAARRAAIRKVRRTGLVTKIASEALSTAVSYLVTDIRHQNIQTLRRNTIRCVPASTTRGSHAIAASAAANLGKLAVLTLDSQVSRNKKLGDLYKDEIISIAIARRREANGSGTYATAMAILYHEARTYDKPAREMFTNEDVGRVWREAHTLNAEASIILPKRLRKSIAAGSG